MEQEPETTQARIPSLTIFVFAEDIGLPDTTWGEISDFTFPAGVRIALTK
jgi:hypothetical protein